MHALLGLFLFSALLTAGTSLECETCNGEGDSCSGPKVTCATDLDTCMNIVIKGSAQGQSATATSKACSTKEACAQMKPGTSFSLGGVSGTIEKAECNMALRRSSSVLLALSGFLLLKTLF